MATAAEQLGQGRLTSRECGAARLLHADGCRVGEIAFMLERKTETVSRHVRGACDHAHAVEEARHV